MSWLWLLLLIPLYFSSLAVKAIRSGRIEHGWQGKTDVFYRIDDPWMFWFLTATLIGISIIMFCATIIVSLAQAKP